MELDGPSPHWLQDFSLLSSRLNFVQAKPTSPNFELSNTQRLATCTNLGMNPMTGSTFTLVKKTGVVCFEHGKAHGNWELFWFLTPKILRVLAD